MRALLQQEEDLLLILPETGFVPIADLRKVCDTRVYNAANLLAPKGLIFMKAAYVRGFNRKIPCIGLTDRGREWVCRRDIPPPAPEAPYQFWVITRRESW
jgi:hypothetical protein